MKAAAGTASAPVGMNVGHLLLRGAGLGGRLPAARPERPTGDSACCAPSARYEHQQVGVGGAYDGQLPLVADDKVNIAQSRGPLA